MRRWVGSYRPAASSNRVLQPNQQQQSIHCIHCYTTYCSTQQQQQQPCHERMNRFQTHHWMTAAAHPPLQNRHCHPRIPPSVSTSLLAAAPSSAGGIFSSRQLCPLFTVLNQNQQQQHQQQQQQQRQIHNDSGKTSAVDVKPVESPNPSTTTLRPVPSSSTTGVDSSVSSSPPYFLLSNKYDTSRNNSFNRIHRLATSNSSTRGENHPRKAKVPIIIKLDRSQQRVAQHLHRLQVALVEYGSTPAATTQDEQSLLSRWNQASRRRHWNKQQQQMAASGQHPQQSPHNGGVEDPMATPNPAFQPQQPLSAAPAVEEETSPSTDNKPPPPKRLPKGLYLYGSVGTGKTMLMDAFFQHIPPILAAAADDNCNDRSLDSDGSEKNRKPIGTLIHKRRYHFHEFMHDVHRRLHSHKLQRDAELQQQQSEEEKATIPLSPPPSHSSSSSPHGDGELEDSLVEPKNAPCDAPPQYLQQQQQQQQKPEPFYTALNPVVRVALEMAQEFNLLCLDEFQVVDVADALILGQLLQTLLEVGTVLVTTSNRPVTELYEDGLNRNSHFMPFIQVLQKYCIVQNMNSETDYRQLAALLRDEEPGDLKGKQYPESNMYVVLPTRKQSNEWLDATQTFDFRVHRVLFGSSRSQNPSGLSMDSEQWVELNAGFGRTVRVRQFNRQYPVQKCETSLTYTRNEMVAYCTFDELCGTGSALHSYGPADYRAIARHFGAIVIAEIPVLSDGTGDDTNQNGNNNHECSSVASGIDHLFSIRPRGHNEARRFITLIDELYEAKTLVLCSAHAPISSLFAIGSQPRLVPTFQDGVATPDGVVQNSQVALSASVQELRFAFARAASRLVELTSRQWWQSFLDSQNNTECQ